MRPRHFVLATFYLVVAVLFVRFTSAEAGDKDDAKEQKVAGILIDKTADTLIVKIDGEDEPVKYDIPKTDKKVNDSLKSVFNA